MGLFTEILVSFLGGILTFASPCLLAVQLGYLVLMAIIFLPELKNTKQFNWLNPFAVCLIFSFGFSLTFILSAYPGYTQRFMMFYHLLLSKIAGGIILYFVIASARKFRINVKNKTFFIIFALGMSLSIAWTHCLNPVLAMIITQSNIPQTALKGLFLLFFYSFGLSIPFVLSGILLNKILYYMKWLRENISLALIISKGILIVIGMSLVFTPWWFELSSYLVGLAHMSFANQLMKIIIDIFGGYS